MQKFLLAAGAAALTFGAGAASAQAPHWQGFYVGATGGYADGRDKKGETIRFDTNLDGVYGDTVRTAAGADAFSPGFCGGSFNTNAAPGGCKSDDDSDTQWSLRVGYDRKIVGNWVVGGLVEYSRVQFQDSVTAFSVTPAAYNFTRKVTDTWAIRARAGYDFDNFLLYATGGLAQGKVKHSFRTTNTVNAFPASNTGQHRKGYQLGGGVEYRVLPQVTIGAEFLRTRLDDGGYTVRAINNGTTAATNAFLLVNTGGTNFRRSNGHVEYNNISATVSYRF